MYGLIASDSPGKGRLDVNDHIFQTLSGAGLTGRQLERQGTDYYESVGPAPSSHEEHFKCQFSLSLQRSGNSPSGLGLLPENCAGDEISPSFGEMYVAH